MHDPAPRVDFIHGRKVTRRKRREKGSKKPARVVREVLGEFGLGRRYVS